MGKSGCLRCGGPCSPSKSNANRRNYQCDPCRSLAARRERLKRVYGITPEVYDLMLEKQGYACAICKTRNPGGKNNEFHIDHDHKTGAIRGLLCVGCNTGIGALKEDATVLMSAYKYLFGETC